MMTEDEAIEVDCPSCGGEGRLYSGHPNDPHPRDAGECPHCGGTGAVWVATAPATLDDIEDADAEEAATARPPMREPAAVKNNELLQKVRGWEAMLPRHFLPTDTTEIDDEEMIEDAYWP